MLLTDLAGLLAWALLNTFPCRVKRHSGMKIQQVIETGRAMNPFGFTMTCSNFTTLYSYGDSAGFTPDFPFNLINYLLPAFGQLSLHGHRHSRQLPGSMAKAIGNN